MASLSERISHFFSGADTHTDEGLRDLFITELKGIYQAEKKTVDALAEQANASTTNEVREAFQTHRDETLVHISRLEDIFRILSLEVEDYPNDSIDGIITDAERTISDTEHDTLTRDAALIIAAQKVEHLEITTYGSLHTLAKVLGFHQCTDLLALTLAEEKAADHKLTQLAESFINQGSKAEETPGSHHQHRPPAHGHTGDVTMGGSLGI